MSIDYNKDIEKMSKEEKRFLEMKVHTESSTLMQKYRDRP